MAKYAEMFGLGAPGGIDLPGEVDGLVPNKKWKRLNYAESWLTGDTYNMAIGQGFVLVTPLQLLNAMAAVANGGTLYRPHLVKEILDADGNLVKTIEPEAIRRLDIEPQFIQLVRQGLQAVVNWENGTAHDTFDVPGIDASGKTGTAEFCDRYPQCLDRDGRVKTSHAWFAAYAPSYNPEIVTVVFIYGGGEGSAVAVPVTNKILRYYFGIEEEEAETVEEEEEVIPALQPNSVVTARLLGTDSWRGEGASVSGHVVDAQGRGIAETTVDLIANGTVVAQTMSGITGQFDFTELDPVAAKIWELRLADQTETPLLQLIIDDGLRYLVEIEVQPGAQPVQPPETEE
jgi:penicillin-binding protein 2